MGSAVGLIDTSVRLSCAVILWVTFCAMLFPTFFNAVLRYTTNASLAWSVEVVQLTFPWFIMAGAILAAQHSRHIGVELFVSLVSKSLRRLISILVQLIILVASISVIYVYIGLPPFDGGMGFAAGDVAFTSLGVPQSWSYLALLLGYIFLAATTLTTIYRHIYGEAT